MADFPASVLAAQSNFRAILDATASPGSVRPITAEVPPPTRLTAGAAAVALTLCDGDTPVWLDAALRDSEAVCQWLRFHCGCKLIDAPDDAAFAFVSASTSLPPFATFNRSEEHRVGKECA